jgi:hypothetical protein
MYGPKETLYNILDVSRGASASEIRNAYKKLVQEMRRDSAAPDPRKQALLHEAFEVLSDPRRRREYDRSLEEPGFLEAPERAGFNYKRAGIAAAVVLVAGVAYFQFRSAERQDQGLKELLETASLSAGRVQSLSVSGRTAPLNLAVTIEEGVMVTTCHGMPGGSLVVSNGPRNLAAQVAVADTDLDLCKLKLESGGSWPMRASSTPPRIGDTVFSFGVGADGEFLLYKGTVRSLLSTTRGNAIEITIPITPSASGGPLFDAQGKLLGITTAPHQYGEGLNVALPASWIGQMRTSPAPAAPAKGAARKK